MVQEGQANSKHVLKFTKNNFVGHISDRVERFDQAMLFMDSGAGNFELCTHLFKYGSCGPNRFVVCGIEFNSALFNNAREKLNPTNDMRSPFQFRELNETNVDEVIRKLDEWDFKQCYFFYGDFLSRAAHPLIKRCLFIFSNDILFPVNVRRKLVGLCEFLLPTKSYFATSSSNESVEAAMAKQKDAVPPEPRPPASIFMEQDRGMKERIGWSIVAHLTLERGKFGHTCNFHLFLYKKASAIFERVAYRHERCKTVQQQDEAKSRVEQAKLKMKRTNVNPEKIKQVDPKRMKSCRTTWEDVILPAIEEDTLSQVSAYQMRGSAKHSVIMLTCFLLEVEASLKWFGDWNK